MEPQVSVPMAKGTRPAAVAEAEPADELNYAEAEVEADEPAAADELYEESVQNVEHEVEIDIRALGAFPEGLGCVLRARALVGGVFRCVVGHCLKSSGIRQGVSGAAAAGVSQCVVSIA